MPLFEVVTTTLELKGDLDAEYDRYKGGNGSIHYYSADCHQNASGIDRITSGMNHQEVPSASCRWGEEVPSASRRWITILREALIQPLLEPFDFICD